VDHEPGPKRDRREEERCPARIGAHVSAALAIPTIGIGAGPSTDGQVLVFHDLLGIREGLGARFVKRYANLAAEIRSALETYASEVRSGVYPAPEHTYGMPDDEFQLFLAERVEQGDRES